VSIYLRRSCLAVPEYLAHYVQALAFAHRYRCEAVPQVMYSEAWDIGEGSYFRPNRAERDDVPPAARCRKHEFRSFHCGDALQ
jgi:hypothetical protein